MQSRRVVEELVATIEESFQGYEIFIESNPDYYRGGFDWCVSKKNDIWDSGLAFSVEEAITESQNAIVMLQCNSLHHS